MDKMVIFSCSDGADLLVGKTDFNKDLNIKLLCFNYNYFSGGTIGCCEKI